MKFLIDAQLPYLLAEIMQKKGLDVLHTNNLPNGDFSKDSEIRQFADTQNRIVITKDSDFVDSYLLKNSPKKLLLVSTGNIKNRQLLDIFRKNIDDIIKMFHSYDFIELNNNSIIEHQ